MNHLLISAKALGGARVMSISAPCKHDSHCQYCQRPNNTKWQTQQSRCCFVAQRSGHNNTALGIWPKDWSLPSAIDRWHRSGQRNRKSHCGVCPGLYNFGSDLQAYEFENSRAKRTHNILSILISKSSRDVLFFSVSRSLHFVGRSQCNDLDLLCEIRV